VHLRENIIRAVIPSNNLERVIRAMIALDLFLILLAWFHWFEGSDGAPGAVDALFGSMRLGGFRADVVWLVGSSVAIGLSIPFLMDLMSSTRKATVLLCVVELPAFTVYLHRLFTHLIWFG